MQDDDYPYEGSGGDGQLSFSLNAEPVSLQSKADARRLFDASLATELARYDFLIDSQVSLDVRWWGVPRVRWETDRYPDIDNWLKPLIDAFVGPDRLLVDDSLLRSINLTFSEGLVDKSRIEVLLMFDAEHRLPKRGLVYVQFSGGLCFPYVGPSTAEAAAAFVQAFESQLRAKRELGAHGLHSAVTTQLLRNGWIHRSRLGKGFAVVAARDFLRRAGAEPRDPTDAAGEGS